MAIRITCRELKGLAKAVFKWTDEKKVTAVHHDDFLNWANGALESYDGSGVFELPALFQGVYRDFQKSKDYAPGLAELLLHAEQKANYKPPEQGQGNKPNIWI